MGPSLRASGDCNDDRCRSWRRGRRPVLNFDRIGLQVTLAGPEVATSVVTISLVTGWEDH